VGDDQLVAGVDLGDLFGRGADVATLVGCGQGFTPTQEGVTAQGNDDAHGAVLSKMDRERSTPVGFVGARLARDAGTSV